ncbi:outer membrane protein assembly factor BamB family protein [Cellulomonas dongxiuzhuiae]|uniref:outer membrane protein assembly factor BamB family protein n=1 Tax=Cellulomonas dongxiuzhuiae TaxID=2819979 RepID=UPI001AAE60F7|nr:PQQ-binding-like beta-propeller repeat protein [Cellulomonas dongxiuzhuiae]MBO3089517.1 PQQ-binding-like beta-propeller repeat protein [Cellulomonas dongxiuzhuiae]
MARRGARMHVELVEDDGTPDTRLPAVARGTTADGHDGDADLSDRSRRPSPRARRRVLAAATTVVVVLGTVGVVGQVREAARDRARLAVVATLPHALAPLDGPPEVLWTAETDEVLGATARTPDGLLVGTRNDDDGSATAQATDPATGEVVWEQELLPGSDAPPDAGTDTLPRGGSCLAHGTDGEGLVCFASDARTVMGEAEQRYVAPTVTRLLVLDPHDGAVVTDLSDAVAGTGTFSTFFVLDDLVVVGSLVDGDAQVVAVRPDGAVAWRATVPAAAPPSSRPSQPRADVMPLGPDVLVATPSELRILDATGATLRSFPVGPGEVLSGTSGASALTSPDSEALIFTRIGTATVATGARTRLVRADRVGGLAGRWVPTNVDDGSADGLLLTVDGDGLHGWDSDGTLRWTAAGVPASLSSVHVLGERIHLVVRTDLVTYDARTGAELWRHGGLVDVQAPLTEPPLTDGRRLLVRTAGDEGRATDLVALDAADGSVAWRAPFPEGVELLQAKFGALVGVTPAEDGSDWGVTVLG